MILEKRWIVSKFISAKIRYTSYEYFHKAVNNDVKYIFTLKVINILGKEYKEYEDKFIILILLNSLLKDSTILQLTPILELLT